MNATELIVVDPTLTRSAEIGALLVARGYRVRRVGDSREAVREVRERWPALVILEWDAPDSGEVRAAARERDIPVLWVVENLGEPLAFTEKAGDDDDDWVALSRWEAELPTRAEVILRRRRRSGNPAAETLPATDARFMALVIHDMRTPLNVITLSLRMINQAVPKGNAELDEDLRFVEDNFKQIERMLAQMSDYFRLYEDKAALWITEFSPKRLVAELLEARALKSGSASVRLVVADSCPEEASLDQNRARTALQYVLTNAVAAAHGNDEVVVTLSGGPERWVTEVTVDRSPSSSVKSVELLPNVFERLCGTADERRGMDLAIAARVSELFGGTARLDVLLSGGTSVILNWPARMAETD